MAVTPRSATLDHLERSFMDIVTVSPGKAETLLCGNGPHIFALPLEMEPGKGRPIKTPYVDIFVFSVYPETVRGVVDMLQDGYIIAFGNTYLAFIQKSQVLAGGTVCQSQIVSTFRFVIGGRRTGPNTVQLFFRNGSVEKLRISQSVDGLKISRFSVKKYGIESPTQFTFCLPKAKPLLLGTSNGDIVKASGTLGYEKTEPRIPVTQITPVGKYNLLVLYKNENLELIDVNSKTCLSSLEGRYTAMEQTWRNDGGTIIIGDIDGSLHGIDIKNSQLYHMVVQKQQYKERISCLFRLRNEFLMIGTVTGGFRLINRSHFLPPDIKPTVFASPDLENVPFVLTSHYFVSLKDDKLVSIPKNPKQPGLMRKIGNVVEFSAPKLRMAQFINQRREIVCAYSKLSVYVRMTEFGKHVMTSFTRIQDAKMNRHFNNKIKNITAVVAQEDFLFVQGDNKEIAVFKFDFDEAKLNKLFSFTHPIEGETSRITTGSIIEFEVNYEKRIYVVVIGFLDGKVGGYDGEAIKKTECLDVVDIDLNGSFLCDSLVVQERFITQLGYQKLPTETASMTLLTAKGLCIKVTSGHILKSIGQQLFRPMCPVVPIREWYLGTVIGGHGKLIDMDGEIAVAGFRQNTLSLFSLLNADVFASIETAGRRKPFKVIKIFDVVSITHTIPYSSQIVTQTIVTDRIFPFYGLVNAAPVNCLLSLRHKADNVSYFLRGDSNGILSLNSIFPSPTCPTTRYADWQLDGAVTCMAQQKEELIYVGTSKGTIYRFDRYGAGAEMSKFDSGKVDGVPVAMLLHPYPKIKLAIFCQDGTVRTRACNTFPAYAKFPCMLKTGMEYYDEQGHYTIFGISTDNVLHRIGPYNEHLETAGSAQQRTLVKIQKGMNVSSFTMERTASFDKIIAGSTDGWMYFMCHNVETKKCLFAFADRYHFHEIIEVKQFMLIGKSKKCRRYIVSMDSIGFIVVREYDILDEAPYMKLTKQPTCYQSAVPSLRCMEVILNGEQVVVGGLGMSFHDFNATK